MGMTMSQKILAKHAGLEKVESGQLILAKVDLVHGNDITTPVAIREREKIQGKGVFDKDKVVFVMDHFVPNKDITSAKCTQICRNYAKENGLKHYYDVGNMGIEHALIPEQGLITAGELSVGADSHTCTYGALGAFSTGVGSTDMAAAMATGELWFKVPNAIQVILKGKLQKYVSGKDVILHLIGKIGVDGALYESIEFSMKAHGNKPYTVYEADSDAKYERVIEIDLSTLQSTVAFPHLPENTHEIGTFDKIPIDQVVIGSCTNGRLSDIAVSAELLRGRHVAENIRCIVIPATQKIYLEAMEKGYIKDLIEAGAVVSTPTCGPCLGGYMGILAPHERCVSTTNRNFVGRMGDASSEIYLASPEVAAASAVLGYITGPKELGL